MSFSLPKLPYAYDALEPYIDEQTMRIHHTKHHQTYVDKLNASLKDHKDLQKRSVEELLKDMDALPEKVRTAVRNHGGGHANHSFFWPLLKKGIEFGGDIAGALKSKFGDFDTFKERFSTSATLLFGSGWAWLVMNGEELEIMTTPNQDSPLIEGKMPVLGLDVWEHAYYLKYQNRRPEYISAFFNVINWEQVNENYKEVKHYYKKAA